MKKNKMDFRDPLKMASNARCIAKTAWRLIEKAQEEHQDINNILDVIDFKPELTWRPQGKEWNALEGYIRIQLRTINKKTMNGKDGEQEKTDIAATFVGLGLMYNFDIKLDSKGGQVHKVFIYEEETKETPHRLLHTINID